MTLADFPALNAGLNGASAVLVALGWVAIRRQQQLAHVVCMAAATVVSAVFLVSFSYGFFAAGGAWKFPASTGLAGYICGTLSISHVVASLTMPILVTMAYVPVWRQHWNRHRRIGKLTLPVWLYASASGVLAYLISRTTF